MSKLRPSTAKHIYLKGDVDRKWLKNPGSLWATRRCAGSQLPVVLRGRFLSFPRKICDGLQALGLANIFQICAWPPSRIHIPLITPVEESEIPAKASLSLLRVRLPPAEPSAPRSFAASASGVCPGAACINSVLRKSWADFWKTPTPSSQHLFFFFPSRFSSVTQTPSCRRGDGEGVVYTSWLEQRVWRPGQNVCECFRLWKNKCDLRNRKRKKKKKKRGKMKWKTTAGRTGTWRHSPNCRISNDLGKNVPEYSRRPLCSWQADSPCPSPSTPHHSGHSGRAEEGERLLLFPGLWAHVPRRLKIATVYCRPESNNQGFLQM